MVGSEASGQYATRVCRAGDVGGRNAISQPQLWVYGRPTLTGLSLSDLTTWRAPSQPVQVEICVQVQHSRVKRVWDLDRRRATMHAMDWRKERRVTSGDSIH